MLVQGKSKKLIDVLREANKISQEQAASFANLSNHEAEKKLKQLGRVTDADVMNAYSRLYSLPIISLGKVSIEKNILEFIPEQLAKEYKIIAFSLEKTKPRETLKVAVAEPHRLTSNLQNVLSELEKSKNLNIELAIITLSDFENAVTKYAQSPAPVKSQFPVLGDEKKNAPVATIGPIDLDKLVIPYDVITKFPEDIARKYKMVVYEAPHPSLIKVAVADPENKKIREILDFIREKNDIAIDEHLATPGQIHRAISKFYKKPELNQKNIEEKKAPPPPKEQESMPQPKKIEPEKIEKPADWQEPRKFELRPEAPQPQKQTIEEAPKLPDEALEVKEQQPKVELVIDQAENQLDEFLGEDIKTAEDLQAIAETGNVPKIVAASIVLAVKKRASDIHIEPSEKNVRIRFRIDGILRDILILPISTHAAIISRIKIMSKLKIDETRVPQDGRFDVKTGEHAIDLRISTLPTVHGEKVAMRILDKSARMYSLEELGVNGYSLKTVIENISKPYGIIMATGPTGSGKSTTLYAILNRISNPAVNIITLEDPVEYEMPGINQCQIKPKIGFTFANGLRSVLRQDPNIIMVGEIRDSETASLATHAALTGHLVLSSLHTNDAAGALPRIVNMGVEPFLITSSINAIIAQRLVRKLCPKCVKPATIPEPVMKEIEEELKDLNLPTPYQFLEGKGCEECDNGYKGRIGIYEVLAMTDKIEALVIGDKPSSEIKAEAIREGMVTMKKDGLLKALKGVTTVNEVLRAVSI